MTGWSLAIDFGTSNTTVSYRVGDGPVQPVQLTPDGFQSPSAVLVGDAGIRVGTEAVRTQQLQPEGFDDAPKLRLGQETALLAGRSVEVADLVGAVLAHVARKAVQAAGGTDPDHVVLTHPYDFAQGRKNALRQAWQRTGIQSRTLTLVSEPAAAVSYFARLDRPSAGAHLAVLDVGAGTCDVAVLRATGRTQMPFEVVGHAGVDDLGGRAVDDVLRAHVFAALRSQGRDDLATRLAVPSSSEDLAAARTLIDQVRQAKHALTENEDAVVVVPAVPGAAGATVTLTYPELEALTAPICSRIRDLLDATLTGSGVTPASLTRLYLTGGSSLLRPLGHAIESLLGGAPATRDNPKMVTALGAHFASGLTPAPQDRAGGGAPPPPVPPAPTPRPEPPRPPQPTSWPQPGPRGPSGPAGPGGPVYHPEPGSSTPWGRIAAVIAVLVVLAAVVSALIVTLGDDDGGRAPGDTSSASVTPGTSPGDTGSPEDPPEDPPTDYERLLDQVPDRSACEEDTGTNGDVLAAASCGSGSSLVSSTYYELYADKTDLDAAYARIVSGRGLQTTNKCADDVASTGTWNVNVDDPVVGEVACYTSDDGSPVLLWSTVNEGRTMLGYAVAADGAGYSDLFAWWQTLDT